VLIRHGHSVAQQRRVIGGHAGCTGLSDLGRRQAVSLADRLLASGELTGAAALYSSVMPRAVETASLLSAALGLPDVRQDCDLCERHPGEGDGLGVEEYDLRYPAPARWTPDEVRSPGAESWSRMGGRVRRVLDSLIERHPGDTVVVVCHGGVIEHSIVRWLDLDPDRQAERAWIKPVNTSLTEWRVAANPFLGGDALPVQLVRFNDAAHVAT
jgi:probable phosphoglycerate mutase